MKSNLREGLVLVTVAVFSSLLVWTLVGINTIYENFDGPYYAVVAKTWYEKGAIANNFSFPLPLEYYPAHLPFFPLLMSLVALGSINLLTSGLIINVAAGSVVSVMLLIMYKKMGISYAFWLALAWLFLWPRMWAVRSVVSPETLFVGLIFASIYLFEKKSYLLAAVFGVLATLTKSPGLLLLPTYMIYLIVEYLKTKKIVWQAWPVLLIPTSFLFLCAFYYIQTGDFLAYFNSGDNHHLGLFPFTVFDASQSWVGTFWLEDILWVYMIGMAGSVLALKRNRLWGIFGVVFMTAVIFVSHRDISRYSLPVVPVVLLGVAEVFKNKYIRFVIIASLIPMFFYTINFILYNRVAISDWTPFYLFSK